MTAATEFIESAITVTASEGGQTAVWRISLEPVLFGEVTGSWAFPDGDVRLEQVTSGSRRIADPSVVIKRWQGHLTERLAVLSGAFDAYLQESDPLVPPAWPPVPKRAPASPAVDRPPVVEHVLVEARLLASLLRAWNEAEDERARVLGVITGRAAKLASELDAKAMTPARRAKVQRQLNFAESAITGPLATALAPPLDLLTSRN